MSQNNVQKLTLNPSDLELAQFCIAVREKLDWQTKIFDDKIALKWVVEAGVAVPNAQVLEGRALEAVIDLQRSASMVKMLDCDILLDAPAPGTCADSSPERFDINTVDHELSKSIFVSDNLVPQALHQEFIRQLDALAAKEPRDFHPGSFGKVQNLIHPSLFPYIAGTTPVSSLDVKLPPVESDNKFETYLYYTNFHSSYPENMISSYAWIPSVFSILPDGKDAHLDSYINGLGTREQYPGLFRVIEKMFLLSLPHFERTLMESANYHTQDTPSGLVFHGLSEMLTSDRRFFIVQRWYECRRFAHSKNTTRDNVSRQEWTQLLHEHEPKRDAQKYNEERIKEKLQQDIRQEDCIKEKFYDLGDEFAASEMYKGKNMKVIMKAANYILKPGQEYEGSWHMEGMPHERIVASVIYYYDTDGPIQDKGLSFRMFRNFPSEDHVQQDFLVYLSEENGDQFIEEDYPSDWEMEVRDGKLAPVSTDAIPFFIELGAVPTTNICSDSNSGIGRMLSFPNWLQFCFFLVDDTLLVDDSEILYPGFDLGGLEDMNVLTTSEVPMQMRRCNEPTMFSLISMISARLTGRALPPELLDIIWSYTSEGTLTREEAEMHRLRLMNDRKVSHRTPRDYYSLCEH
ncbi:hypothetical protein BDP27DRAFT_1423620 [Rhodocollybia butyracea]|uniref:DUF4246 domain-containing protein n=1 Tax=Rhodocollybia butyracea TaxID=206335 RepID=A0A9P5PNV6_9AGAR|nr:hypothetical protein BDP27DRAFT_1423620 [Rhodocollybia butyracea]